MQSPQWWEKRKEPIAIDLNIPAPADAPQPKKVRKGFFLHLGAIVLRLLGVAVAAGCIGFGAWICYQIPNDLSVTGITSQVAQGGFLVLAGLLVLIAELRTRWTMRGCMNTYILFSNYLARGFVYIFLGGLCFALNATPPYIKLSWLAGGFIGVGGLNVVFYPFYWKYLRAKAFAKENEIPKIAFPEEVVYGMNTQYIKNGQPAEPVRVKEETVEPNATELSTVSTNAETVEPPKEAHTIDIPSGKGKEPMKRFDDEKFEEIEISPEPIGAGAC